jgi:hypothetical protein
LHVPLDRRLRVTETLIEDRDAKQHLVSLEAINARRGALRNHGLSRLERFARWRVEVRE